MFHMYNAEQCLKFRFQLFHDMLMKQCYNPLMERYLNLPLLVSYLKHLVRRCLYARHHVSWVEGTLFNLSKVVLGIPVQHHLAHRNQRELCMWPDLQNKKHSYLKEAQQHLNK